MNVSQREPVARLGMVWNPSKTSREELDSALAVALDRTGASPTVDWFETSEDDPGRAAAAAAIEAGADVVIAAGGDGTVRAVAEELGESGAPVELGIAPLGTGNLLARNLGVPVNDLAAAFERALVGEASRLDLGWATVALGDGERRVAFAVMAGLGIDAHMIVETDDELKAKAGWLAYIESLGRAVSASEVIGLRVSSDGGASQTVEAHTLMIGNCGMLQGGITLLPDADPVDGELDLLLLDAAGIGGWLDTARNMMWDNGLKRLLMPRRATAEGAQSSESVTHRRVTSMAIELDEPRVFEVDGDDLGETTRIEIEVQPGALRVR